MRITHVTSDSGVGGAGRYLMALLAQPAWRDDDITVVVPPGELAARLRAEARGRWRTEELPAAGPARDRSLEPRAILPLAQRLRRARPDVVHAHSSLTARLAARLAGVPAVVYTRHGSSRRASAQWGGGRLTPLRRRAERLLRDHAVAVSRQVAEELVADGVPPDRVHVVPVGVDPSPCRGALDRRAAWRDRLGAGGDDVVVVGSGRLVPEKDWATWIRAARGASAAAGPAGAGTSLRFFIAGDGPERERLGRACREAGLPSGTLLGFVDDVPGLLAAADVFMLTSRTEGLALAVIEAMHAGLPVVATQAGGLPEAVRDGETGFLVPVGDADAAARALLRLAADPVLRRTLGAAGRDLAERAFTAAGMAQRVRELYTRLLGGGAR